MSHATVRREFAISKDGTQIPLTILLPAGAQLDGTAACLATGYGGYGVSLGPRFRRTTGLWLEQGVINVVANLRGGGEFGEAWHLAGNLENKQNVFDDFAAVLRHLIAGGYTSSARLGIIGGSNGGLLMGATLVQQPNLMRAVVSYVGIYDMLRVELSPNGAFNVTEFGSVKNKTQFQALLGYSPYHHVAEGTSYPRALLLAGENDPRVEPMQSRKMTARLQAASAALEREPILLRTSAETGHGGDTNLEEEIAEQVDVQAFMLDALGVRVTQGSAPRPASE
jgi:prolyl oligopeptidase